MVGAIIFIVYAVGVAIGLYFIRAEPKEAGGPDLLALVFLWPIAFAVLGVLWARSLFD